MSFNAEFQQSEAQQPPRRSAFPTGHVLFAAALVLSLGAAVYATHLYLAEKNTAQLAQARLQQLERDPEIQGREQTVDLIAKVAALVALPQGESPTVATVTDPNKLADQPFFSEAQLGDKVLIYAVAKKAILYRQSANKIIEIAPLNLQNANQENAVTTTKSSANAAARSAAQQ